jgi:hypothetical protein
MIKLKELMFPLEFNRHDEVCGIAVKYATEYLLSKGITKFKIYVGSVKVNLPEDKLNYYNTINPSLPENYLPHVWIKFDNGRVFDPTKKQFNKLGITSVEYILDEDYTTIFSPEQYLKSKLFSFNK